MALRRTAALVLGVVALLCGAAADADAQILSSKRGFADVGASYNNLQATGAGWYYTWGTGDANPGSYNAKHIPMIWGGTPSQGTINNIINSDAEYVLGFNEPERPDQANMTVAQAISSWTTMSNGFAGSGVKLISPAVADTGGATGGQAWLASFMSQAAANNLTVDAVAFHWYGVSTPANPAGSASSFLSRVDSYHNSYNKPVFITEFAIHDWGGAYTNEEIIEANRQFLDIVIPGLESRSYVAGYSWYHWFSDAPLYSQVGSSLLPTQMGYSYVGALTSGKTQNIAGTNFGEHVAFMAGGDLTMTGSSPGTLKYINALRNSSTISGTTDWGLAGGGWTRIQTGATLRKTGTNQVTLAGGLSTNNGLLEVSQGTLNLAALMTGTGKVIVKGGTLAVAATGRVGLPLTEVRAGGTFNVSAMNIPYVLAGGRSLSNDTGGTVVGNVFVNAISTVSGGGAFNGNITSQGGLVRVGKDGAGVATRLLIDNFQSYALGDVATVASPTWTAHQNTTQADVESDAGNKVLTYGVVSGARGVSRSLPEAAVLDNSETGTFFFRINSKTNDPDHNIGLGDKATTTGVDFADYEAQLRLNVGAGSTFTLDARNGGAFTSTLASGLALNSWYNIWMVVNQATDRYDIYMNTGTGAATIGNRIGTNLAFRNGTTSDLNTILALSNSAPVDNGVRIDDLIFQTGVDLTNPLAGFNPGLAWMPETMTVNGNFAQDAGAVLELNIFTPARRDMLHVTGAASLSGTLTVTLAVNAPQPQLGDAFDLFDFGSSSGSFSALQLPALGAGLKWDANKLLTTGALTVVAVPEPATLSIALMAVAAMARRRRRN